MAVEQGMERGRPPDAGHDEKRDRRGDGDAQDDAVEVVVVVRRDDAGAVRGDVLDTLDGQAEPAVQHPGDRRAQRAVEQGGVETVGDVNPAGREDGAHSAASYSMVTGCGRGGSV